MSYSILLYSHHAIACVCVASLWYMHYSHSHHIPTLSILIPLIPIHKYQCSYELIYIYIYIKYIVCPLDSWRVLHVIPGVVPAIFHWEKVFGVRGRRVVRTPKEPWGRASLSLRELQLCISMPGCLVCVLGHRPYWAPQKPGEGGNRQHLAITIDAHAIGFPNMRLVHLAQGLFGAPSAKPTSLLVLGLPTLEQELDAHRVTSHLPTGVSIGKTAAGDFQTAPLKEYPLSMCKAIAASFITEIVGTECNETSIPAELVERCKAMSAQHFGDHIGHDG